MPVLLFPNFDPVLVQIGPFAIRWYALAYITGLVLGWRLVRRLVLKTPIVATPEQVDDVLQDSGFPVEGGKWPASTKELPAWDGQTIPKIYEVEWFMWTDPNATDRWIAVGFVTQGAVTGGPLRNAVAKRKNGF